jgi:Na+/H+-dicarboxylate symporter
MKAGMSTEVQRTLFNQIIFPFERLFSNAMLMVAAPVTFFSLLKNLTDAYIVAERNSSLRRLQRSTLVSSVVSVMLAILFGHLWVIGLAAAQGKPIERMLGMDISLADIINSLMPSNIFEPFVTVSPFPLIILAALTTYAFCSVGQYFDSMKNVINGAYTLFSRMLSVVMFTLPFFCFMAIMDILIDRGIIGLINLLVLVIPATVGVFVLAAYYAIRMKRDGVEVIPFAKKLGPLIHENFKINSAINAVPFNVRYCTVKYGMDKKSLEDSLPLLAQVNLDGNCFMISFIAMLYIHLAQIDATWFEIIAIGALVLFLSLGAPNQPGSAIIGMLIISNYLGAYDMLPMAIISEILFGSLLNIINVIGDIVTVAIEEKRAGRDPNAPQEGKVIVRT